MISLKRCLLNYNDNWKIELNNDKIFLYKNDKEKEVSINCIQNLEVFFDRYELYECDNPTLIIECEDGVYSLIDDEVLKELELYFNNYYDNEIKPVKLSFHSFDGGGPEYTFENEIKGIVTWYYKRQYLNENHDKMCGSGYDINIEFYPIRKGHATTLVKSFSPICPSETLRIIFDVDEKFNIEYKIEEVNL